MPLILVVPRLRKYAAGNVIDAADEESFAARYAWAVAEVSEADAKKAADGDGAAVLQATINKLAELHEPKPDKPDKPAKPEPKPDAPTPAADPAEEAKS